jgi:hypothetical protein
MLRHGADQAGRRPSEAIMAQIHWAGGSGIFSDAANWVGGVVPGASDGAILDAPPLFAVTSDVSETVRSIQTVAGAGLDITGGTFIARFGTGSGANAGGIDVGANAALVVGGGGTLVNSGHISVGDLGGKASLIFNQSTALTRGGATNGVIALMFRDGTIRGARASVVLTNEEYIQGAGKLGDGKLTLINGVGDSRVGIVAVGGLLTINTGHNTITNAGLIEAFNGSKCVITSALDNTGTLKVGGRRRSTAFMKVEGAVTGSGSALISHGTLDFTSSFNENVAFTGTHGHHGHLELAQSQTYGGGISGFSKTGKTSLDLVDIGFVTSTEATFSGTTSSGVLTVTDGTHTAHITLIGDYIASTFTAKSDGHGGTVVVDPARAASAPVHRFIVAMAGLVAPSGEAIHASDTGAVHAPMLARPRAMVA